MNHNLDNPHWIPGTPPPDPDASTQPDTRRPTEPPRAGRQVGQGSPPAEHGASFPQTGTPVQAQPHALGAERAAPGASQAAGPGSPYSVAGQAGGPQASVGAGGSYSSAPQAGAPAWVGGNVAQGDSSGGAAAGKDRRPSGRALAGAGSLLAVLAFLGGTAVGHAWGSSSGDTQQNQFTGPGGGRFRQFPGQQNQGGTQQNPGGTQQNQGGTQQNPGGTQQNPDGTQQNQQVPPGFGGQGQQMPGQGTDGQGTDGQGQLPSQGTDGTGQTT